MEPRGRALTMGKATFDVARIASPDDVADAIRAIAAGLRRGEVSLVSAKRTLRLETAPEMKLELTVKSQGSKGKIAIAIGWKRRSGAKAADLESQVGRQPIGSASSVSVSRNVYPRVTTL